MGRESDGSFEEERFYTGVVARWAPGSVEYESAGKGVVWWPVLDGMVGNVVKNSLKCQQAQPLPTSPPMQPWSWPTRHWSRLHVDFAGPL